MSGFGFAELVVVLVMAGGSVTPEPMRSLLTTMMRSNASVATLWLLRTSSHPMPAAVVEQVEAAPKP